MMTKKRLTPIARRLRRDMTDAEILLWSRLRGQQLGAKFTKQFPIGDAVADFACRSARLVVEVDGGQHAAEADAERTRIIELHGYRVIRFWNSDVMTNIDGVLEAIAQELDIALPLEGCGAAKACPGDRPAPHGWVGVSDAGDIPHTSNPLTPTLSPPGRGSKAGADDEDGGDVCAAGHYVRPISANATSHCPEERTSSISVDKHLGGSRVQPSGDKDR
jgi:BirA family biotin operon repressor/biotin-[acetyl-CoA-carboxylase] ligase